MVYLKSDFCSSILSGAHARFVPFGEDCSERQWRVQTLEPDPWMFEVEKYGHGTRKAQPQNQLAV